MEKSNDTYCFVILSRLNFRARGAWRPVRAFFGSRSRDWAHMALFIYVFWQRRFWTTIVVFFMFWRVTRIVKRSFTRLNMAKSQYEYVKDYEEFRKCIPNTWFVVKVDVNFARCDRNLELMTSAAKSSMTKIKEIAMGYGGEDEFSFVFRKNVELYNRRSRN